MFTKNGRKTRCVVEKTGPRVVSYGVTGGHETARIGMIVWESADFGAVILLAVKGNRSSVHQLDQLLDPTKRRPRSKGFRGDETRPSRQSSLNVDRRPLYDRGLGVGPEENRLAARPVRRRRNVGVRSAGSGEVRDGIKGEEGLSGNGQSVAVAARLLGVASGAALPVARPPSCGVGGCWPVPV